MPTIRARKQSNGITRYHAQIRIKGFPTRTETLPTRAAAVQWTLQAEAELRAGTFRLMEAKQTQTVAQMIDRYIRDVLPEKARGGSNERAALMWWRSKLGTRLLSEVTPDQIGLCRDELRRTETTGGKTMAPATVLRYLMILSHCFSTAAREWQWCKTSPVAAVKKPKVRNARKRYLNEPERVALLAACQASSNSFLYVVVVVAISTGMRKSEIMGMRWSEITFFDGYAKLLLRETKNGQDRPVMLVGHALELLLALRPVADRKRNTLAPSPASDLIFPSISNSDQPVDLRKPWEAALVASDVKDFRFHDLRHTAASYLAMGGASVLDIKEVLGHRSTAMAERYSHLSANHVDAVVRKMNEATFAR